MEQPIGGAGVGRGGGRGPLLVPVEAAGEVREQAVHAHLVYPELVLRIRVLAEVKVKELVLVPVRVGVHLRKIH